MELRSLVRRATQHDPDAWERLYRHAYPRLYGYARRRLFDDLAAEDAVSETMTRALNGIDRFTWRGPGFDAWLYGIARNVVLEHGRSRRRTVCIDADERPADTSGPEERLLATAESEALRVGVRATRTGRAGAARAADQRWVERPGGGRPAGEAGRSGADGPIAGTPAPAGDDGGGASCLLTSSSR